MIKMQKIHPFLWFDDQAEEAALHYISIFPNSKMVATSRTNQAGPGPAGRVLTVTFELEGLSVIALNGGPIYKFNEAFSLMVTCDSQAEVDHYWDRLGAGGQWGPCGWLKDRYGLSWQVAPKAMFGFLQHEDKAAAARAMAAMMKMGKLEIAALQAAFDGIGG